MSTRFVDLWLLMEDGSGSTWDELTGSNNYLHGHTWEASVHREYILYSEFKYIQHVIGIMKRSCTEILHNFITIKVFKAAKRKLTSLWQYCPLCTNLRELGVGAAALANQSPQTPVDNGHVSENSTGLKWELLPLQVSFPHHPHEISKKKELSQLPLQVRSSAFQFSYNGAL